MDGAISVSIEHAGGDWRTISMHGVGLSSTLKASSRLPAPRTRPTNDSTRFLLRDETRTIIIFGDLRVHSFAKNTPVTASNRSPEPVKGMESGQEAGFASGSGSRRSHRVDLKRKFTPVNDVVVEMFQWNWESVAAECTAWLGPRGYGYAQVSPPTETINGTEWFTSYSPVSYEVKNKEGTRAQFASMVQICNAAGVGVLVDVVLNLAEGSGVGFDGNSFGDYAYPAVPWMINNFHSYCDIDYTNQTSIWDCTLEDLPDLKTETVAVQNRQITYLNDLISMGVSGFRVDAAMWMPPDDLKIVFSTLTEAPYVVQEVSYGEGNPVTPQLYTEVGYVHEFRAMFSITDALINGGGISSLLLWPSSSWVASASANVFAANHDTERSGDQLNYTNADNAYTLAQVFILAQPYGTPSLLSGYNFTTTSQGAPLDSNDLVLATTCWEDGWRCEQRWPDLVNMVAFHNAVSGTTWSNLLATSTNRISFGRGAIGHVAINNEATAWDVSIATDMPNGSYCEIISDTNPSATVCAGTTITVKGGVLTATVTPYHAIAIYTGALPSSS